VSGYNWIGSDNMRIPADSFQVLHRIRRKEPDMDLKQLRYFIGICDAGSITGAAKLLGVAQPALSKL